MPQDSESQAQSRNFETKRRESHMTLERILSATALILAFSFSGCGSGSGSGSSGGSGATNIYIAGATGIATGFNTDESIATYWKNGTATKLTDGTSYAGASAIAVDS